MGPCWPAFVLAVPFRCANRIPMRRYWGLSLRTRFPTGHHGYELAWQCRRFGSFEHFRRTMAVWDRWARVIMGLGLALFGVVMVGALVQWAVGSKR